MGRQLTVTRAVGVSGQESTVTMSYDDLARLITTGRSFDAFSDLDGAFTTNDFATRTTLVAEKRRIVAEYWTAIEAGSGGGEVGGQVRVSQRAPG